MTTAYYMWEWKIENTDTVVLTSGLKYITRAGCEYMARKYSPIYDTSDSGYNAPRISLYIKKIERGSAPTFI